MNKRSKAVLATLEGCHFDPFEKKVRLAMGLEAKLAQNERGCHQRQCNCSTHLFRHLREAKNHPKGLCQNLL
jgi:hypothetical protein